MIKMNSSSKEIQNKTTSNKSAYDQNDQEPLMMENDEASAEPSALRPDEGYSAQNERDTDAAYEKSNANETAPLEDKTEMTEEQQETVYSDKTEVIEKDAISERSETQNQNLQTEGMENEEIERVTKVLSVIPAKEETDKPMLFKKERIREHKHYLYVRGWLLVALLFVLSAVATVLTFITIEDLYTNLSPFLGAYFSLFAVVALLHVLINVNRLPYWGFTIFPILIIGVIGVILLAFVQQVQNLFYLYVVIGIWAVAMLAFVHSMLLKGLMPMGWLFLMVPSIIVVAISVVLSFYPFVLSYGDAIGIIYDAVSAVTPLMITRGLFIAISVLMLIDTFLWFIVKVREKDRLGIKASPKNRGQKTKKTPEKPKSNQDETPDKTEDQEKQPIDQVDSET